MTSEHRKDLRETKIPPKCYCCGNNNWGWGGPTFSDLICKECNSGPKERMELAAINLSELIENIESSLFAPGYWTEFWKEFKVKCEQLENKSLSFDLGQGYFLGEDKDD